MLEFKKMKQNIFLKKELLNTINNNLKSKFKSKVNGFKN
jgi:hypothetical protein